MQLHKSACRWWIHPFQGAVLATSPAQGKGQHSWSRHRWNRVEQGRKFWKRHLQYFFIWFWWLWYVGWPKFCFLNATFFVSLKDRMLQRSDVWSASWWHQRPSPPRWLSRPHWSIGWVQDECWANFTSHFQWKATLRAPNARRQRLEADAHFPSSNPKQVVESMTLRYASLKAEGS